ncbi:MAG: hypothetical protein HY649_08005 [Acidobacteria bacterium]|nr:hypothetical protein [Acidobacteriota bacterium]
MSISGHRTCSIFDRYNMVSEKDPRQAVQKTQAYLNAVPSKSPVVSIAERSGGLTVSLPQKSDSCTTMVQYNCLVNGLDLA